jgi:polysaccharide pyruvyl transferase WcaK-like protein
MSAWRSRVEMAKASLSLGVQWLRQWGKPSLAAPDSADQRLLIVPCDPWTFTGSRGDQAMIEAVCRRIRAAYPHAVVAAITASEVADAAARAQQVTPLRGWSDRWRLARVMQVARDFRPTMAFILGADVMDGYYDPFTSARLLVVADCLARADVRCVITGFSFNRKPHPLLRHIFNNLDQRVVINVRDRRSYERFRAFSRAPANLVADAAFMLKPDLRTDATGRAVSWVHSQKSHGRRVLALNVHPMLFRDATAEAIQRLNDTLARELRTVLAAAPSLSLLFLAHDDRSAGGDGACLGPIHQQVRSGYEDRLFYESVALSAAEAKVCVSEVDGVITGRMHLAIAALGAGVPVVALTYQDKFQGLFEHFSLPSHYLLDDSIFMVEGQLSGVVVRFLAEMADLQQMIARELPSVLALSELNMRGLTEPSPLAH